VLTLILHLFIDNTIAIKSFLENKANTIVGIIMIFISLIMLNIINLHFPDFKMVEKIRNKTSKSPHFFIFLFGILFAGMFCPVKVGLFMANFLQNQSILSALIYGFFTGTTMILLSITMVLLEEKFNIFKNNSEKIEKYTSKITGIIFFIMGLGLIFELF
jgi:hypothetical protein